MNHTVFARDEGMKAALAVHDQRVKFIDSLAILMGCWEPLGREFPDGTRPDVLRINTHRNILFVGEGKNTESPRNQATRARLRGYIRWMGAHSASKRTSIVAVCFGKDTDTAGWGWTLHSLGVEAGIRFHSYGFQRFGEGLNVVWAVAGAEHKMVYNKWS